MQLNTKHFGLLEIEEDGIVEFPGGIPGFDKIIKFVVLGNEDEKHPFKWLQCVDDPSVAFVIVNPFDIVKDYDIEIDEETTKKLGIEATEDLMIFSVVVIPEDVSKMSMNLKAPIVINQKKKKGAQIILDTNKYSVRHYILEELQG